MLQHCFASLAFIAGLVLLYYGADYLVKGGVGLACKLHISSLVIGLTLVAFGTSAPELVVSCHAALNNLGDISIGNVVGSNICNIALILGLCALITPLSVNPRLFRLDVPLLIGSALLAAIFHFFTQGINRWQSTIFLTGVIVYTSWSILKSRHCQEEESAAPPPPRIWFSLLLTAAGLLALIIGARLFTDSAVYFARRSGIPEAVIGLTLIAIGTSLPELATSVVAACKGEKDIAIGNVVGSNIFNILAILGIAPLLRPLSAPGISIIDFACMLFLSILLLPIMLTGRRISRGEGAVLLGSYGTYLTYLIFTA
ncbi:MAG: calcium/sodium antiporter [Lentisphaeria bacterium]